MFARSWFFLNVVAPPCSFPVMLHPPKKPDSDEGQAMEPLFCRHIVKIIEFGISELNGT